MKAELKRFAHSIGIAKLGVTHAGPFWDMRQRLEQRRASTGLSPFEEPDIDFRIDPQRQLPGAKALISIAVSYRVKPPFASADKAITRRKPLRSAVRRRPPWRGWLSKH